MSAQNFLFEADGSVPGATGELAECRKCGTCGYPATVFVGSQMIWTGFMLYDSKAGRDVPDFDDCRRDDCPSPHSRLSKGLVVCPAEQFVDTEKLLGPIDERLRQKWLNGDWNTTSDDDIPF